MSEMPSWMRIRPIVVSVFRRGGRILVSEAFDPVKCEAFYRPIGGAIEFGESSEAALIREIREEIDAEIQNPRLLGVLENLFTFNGETGHEIVFVYDAEFADPSHYERNEWMGYEIDIDEHFRLQWISADDLRLPGAPPTYPDGLLDLLLVV